MLYYGRFIPGAAMTSGKSKRRTAIYCPQCGHMEVRARTCDIEMQCRRCNYQFEAVIGPYADVVCDRGEKTYGEPDGPNVNQANRSKPNNQTHRNPDSQPEGS